MGFLTRYRHIEREEKCERVTGGESIYKTKTNQNLLDEFITVIIKLISKSIRVKKLSHILIDPVSHYFEVSIVYITRRIKDRWTIAVSLLSQREYSIQIMIQKIYWICPGMKFKSSLSFTFWFVFFFIVFFSVKYLWRWKVASCALTCDSKDSELSFHKKKTHNTVKRLSFFNSIK